MKVAIVYDRVNTWGGAERVLLTLHEMFPEASLFTSVYSNESAKWANVFPEIKTSFLQKIPFARKRHQYFGSLMPLAFEQHDFSEFDLVVSVTSESAKGIITSPDTLHICYCLTPTRYLWSGYQEYFGDDTFKFLTKPVIKYLRMWDKVAAARPDVMIAISTEVQARIKKYYDRDSEIIFPSCERLSRRKAPRSESEFYLIVSRLVPYKKTDLVIKAFNKLGKHLIVIGEGSEKKELEMMSRENIIFTGRLTDGELASYYKRAKALIFPQLEDFGIVAVEAQSFGTPVIAYRKGGALDTVVDGKTGVFFDKQTAHSIINAVKRFERMKFDQKQIINNAKRFSKERFKAEFNKIIKNI